MYSNLNRKGWGVGGIDNNVYKSFTFFFLHLLYFDSYKPLERERKREGGGIEA